MQIQRAHIGTPHGANGPHVVASGWFNLDDVGAQVTQNLGGVGAHDDGAEIENSYAGKGAGRAASARVLL